jgi:hypothetical protein
MPCAVPGSLLTAAKREFHNVCAILSRLSSLRHLYARCDGGRIRNRDTQIARKRGKSGKYIDVLGESGLSLKILALRSGRIISLRVCDIWEAYRRFNYSPGNGNAMIFCVRLT